VSGSTFLETFAKRLQGAGDRRGVESDRDDPLGLLGLGEPLVRTRLAPAAAPGAGGRRNHYAGSGARAGAKGCACDGKRSVSVLRNKG
jgi:hypothetical protein